MFVFSTKFFSPLTRIAFMSSCLQLLQNLSNQSRELKLKQKTYRIEIWSMMRVFIPALCNERLDGCREAADHRWPDVASINLHGDLRLIKSCAGIRNHCYEGLPNKYPIAVYVTAFVVWTSDSKHVRYHFWRHPLWCTHGVCCGGIIGTHTKICDLGNHILGHKHIQGFDVSMHEAHIVNDLESQGTFLADPPGCTTIKSKPFRRVTIKKRSTFTNLRQKHYATILQSSFGAKEKMAIRMVKL
mmetsp:Transcript_8196/g.27538  ORF Transcript_8196/g.27538 Transcript_8196/m.27538 type:complete len:243 (-) Transcript_8196:1610-2338(-)